MKINNDPEMRVKFLMKNIQTLNLGRRKFFSKVELKIASFLLGMLCNNATSNNV